MKNSMGAQHSSLRCDRITMSVQNCFGLRDKTTSYETATAEKMNGDKGKENHSTKTRKRSSKRISCTREGCCIRSKTTDTDDFAYNLCDKDTTLSQTDVSELTPSELNSPKLSGENCTCVGDKTSETSECKNTRELQNGVVHNNGFTIVDSQPCSLPSRDMLVHTTDENIIKTVLQPSSQQLISISSNHINTTTYLNNNSNCKHQNNAQSSPNNKDCPDNTTKNTTNARNTSLENEKSETDSNQESTQNKEVVCFQNLIELETNKLNTCIEKWSRVLKGGNLVPCPSEVCDEIRSVIGQSRLVITERFTQFSALVDRAAGKTSSTDEKPVLISDLQGFWDMIYFQVEDVLSKFNSLNELESNNWVSTQPVKNVTKSEQANKLVKKKTAQKKSPPKKTTTEEDKKRRVAARKRLVEARKAMNQRKQQVEVIGIGAEQGIDNEERDFSSASQEARNDPITASCAGSVVGLTTPSVDSPLLTPIPSTSELVH